MLFDNIELSNGISLTNPSSYSGGTAPGYTGATGSILTFGHTGIYNIQFSAQVEKTDPGDDQIFIWPKQNFSNIPDSNSSFWVFGNGAKHLAAWNFMYKFNAQDTFQLAWQSADTGMRILSEAATGGLPAIPSVILTVQQVSNIGPQGPQGATGSKTFVIDHPLYQNKYLVHGCLEGPEAGVYYRGEAEITNNKSVQIYLPDYVSKLASNFTIQITPIQDNINESFKFYTTSRVINNSFTIYGPNGELFWQVNGERNKINVEPYKQNLILNGEGPYKWI
jgi:hypothetical protein